MTPKVSIVIPCYNAGPWIALTIESALAQTWPNREIIVVDDGSRDDSLAIARRYEARDVRVISQANRGASAARNVGLGAAGGDFIQFLDADDLLAPDKIARQVAILTQEGNRDCVVSGAWQRFIRDPSEAWAAPDALWRELAPADWQVLALADNLMIHPGAWLTPRALAAAAGGWDESLSLNDDGEYFARVRFKSRRVLFCDGAISYYRSNLPNSLSQPSSRAALQSSFRSHELIHALLLRHEDSARARRACADAWMHYAHAAHGLAPDLADAAERHARALGGSRVRPGGGLAFQLVDRCFGWRAAVRLRRWRHRPAPPT